MIRRPGPKAPFISKAAAAYPAEMNRWIAVSLVRAARACKANKRHLKLNTVTDGSAVDNQSSKVYPLHYSVDHRENTDRLGFEDLQVLPAPGRNMELSSRKAMDERADMALGGLRRPYRAISKLLNIRVVGQEMRKTLFTLLDCSKDLQQACLQAIGSELPDAGPSERQLILTRRAMAATVGAKSINGVYTEKVATNIRADILGAWRAKAQDPDCEPERWCKEGSPAGILKTPIDRGIFLYTMTTR